MGPTTKKKIKDAIIFVADIALNVAILFVFVFSIRSFIVAPFQIFGPSMCDTLNNFEGVCQEGYGEYILLKKWDYIFNDPQRFDIIVFHLPHKPNTFYIKRIIGMPGDTVEIKSNKVYLNGEILKEEYISPEVITASYTKTKFEVPDDGYLVFGDNRPKSTDARTCFENERNGCDKQDATAYIKKDDIEGKAWVSLWPFKYSRVIEYSGN